MDGGGSRFDQDNTATATEAKSLADMATAKSLAADADWVRRINIFYRRYVPQLFFIPRICIGFHSVHII